MGKKPRLEGQGSSIVFWHTPNPGKAFPYWLISGISRMKKGPFLTFRNGPISASAKLKNQFNWLKTAGFRAKKRFNPGVSSHP